MPNRLEKNGPLGEQREMGWVVREWGPFHFGRVFKILVPALRAVSVQGAEQERA